MKICQIGTGTLPVTPLANGGVEKYIHYLCSSLQELGHNVTLIDVPCVNRPKTNYKIEEVKILFKNHKTGLSHIASELLFRYFSCIKMEKLSKINKFDIISFQGQFPAIFGVQKAKRLGIASVFTLHNPTWSDVASCQSGITRLKFCVETHAEKKVDRVICLSNAVAANVTSFLGVDPAKVLVIPVGIDDSWFSTPHLDPMIQKKILPTRRTYHSECRSISKLQKSTCNS